LLIVVSVAGMVFGEDAARGEIALQLRFLMGDFGARAVQELLNTVHEPSNNAFATVVGVLLMLAAQRPSSPNCRRLSIASGGHLHLRKHAPG
jgi:uncharacterized BrkB/YihY/UPF0761 family membrane protein